LEKLLSASIQNLFHLPYNVLTVLSHLCQGDESLPIVTLRQFCGFSLLLNNAWTDNSLNRRHTLVNVVFIDGVALRVVR